MSRNVTRHFHNKRQIKTRELNEENNINKGIGIARLVVDIALIIYGFNASDSVNRRAGDCPLGQRGIESFQGTVSGRNASKVRAGDSPTSLPTSVTIPNSVTKIGNSVFYECYSLTNVSIGSGVTSIGGGTFGNCPGLIMITVDPANPA
jgi:BspA type Leucine rich repeat region (6 copies)